MADRIRWRSLHDALVAENEALKKERDAAVHRASDLETDLRARDNMIEELKRAVERGRIEGAHAFSGALLELGEKP